MKANRNASKSTSKQQKVKIKDLPVTGREFSKKAERVKGGAAKASITLT